MEMEVRTFNTRALSGMAGRTHIIQPQHQLHHGWREHMFDGERIYSCMLSCFSCIRLFATLWTVACQAPLPMGFSRQEYWSGLPCPPSGYFPNPGIEPVSLQPPELASGFFSSSATRKPLEMYACVQNFWKYLYEISIFSNPEFYT